MPLDPSDPIYAILAAGNQARSNNLDVLAKMMKQYRDTGVMGPPQLPSLRLPSLELPSLGIDGLRQIQRMLQPQGQSLASLVSGISNAPEPGWLAR